MRYLVDTYLSKLVCLTEWRGLEFVVARDRVPEIAAKNINFSLSRKEVEYRQQINLIQIMAQFVKVRLVSTPEIVTKS